MLICMYAIAHHTAWALRCLFLAFEVMREPRCAEQVTGQFSHAFYLQPDLHACCFCIILRTFTKTFFALIQIKTQKNAIFYCTDAKEFLNLPLETIDVYLRHAPETHLNLANSLKKSGRARLCKWFMIHI